MYLHGLHGLHGKNIFFITGKIFIRIYLGDSGVIARM